MSPSVARNADPVPVTQTGPSLAAIHTECPLPMVSLAPTAEILAMMQLVGNYEHTLDAMLPGYAQHTQAMLSTLPTWDFGSHGSVDGSYALKLASRPRKGAQNVTLKRLTFRGFIVSDLVSQYPQFLADMTQWLRDGKIKYREDISVGRESAPKELIGLLRGENFGKKIIRVGADPTSHGRSRRCGRWARRRRCPARGSRSGFRALAP